MPKLKDCFKTYLQELPTTCLLVSPNQGYSSYQLTRLQEINDSESYGVDYYPPTSPFNIFSVKWFSQAFSDIAIYTNRLPCIDNPIVGSALLACHLKWLAIYGRYGDSQLVHFVRNSQGEQAIISLINGDRPITIETVYEIFSGEHFSRPLFISAMKNMAIKASPVDSQQISLPYWLLYAGLQIGYWEEASTKRRSLMLPKLGGKVNPPHPYFKDIASLDLTSEEKQAVINASLIKLGITHLHGTDDSTDNTHSPIIVAPYPYYRDKVINSIMMKTLVVNLY